MSVYNIGMDAKKASKELRRVDHNTKVLVLNDIASALNNNKDEITAANKKDIEFAETQNYTKAFIDRLLLTDARIQSTAKGLIDITMLEDSIGNILSMNKQANGLLVGKKVVPLGVVGIIYESRPNVTIDTFGLCFYTNNAIILKGGKEAINSNIALVKIVKDVLKQHGLNENIISLIEDTTRESTNELMKGNDYLDVLIPRGSSSLINAVKTNSTVPVIETGIGNCHVYIDSKADLEKAVAIAYNAKAQRPGVCNSCETILVHKDVATKFLEEISKLFKNIVEVRGCKKTCSVIDYSKEATKKDYETEFHDYIVAIKVVDSIEEALTHIETYTTYHSEAIVTEDYTNAQLFLDEIDAAAVYVNASTRFTDGAMFEMGAEMGISTQKLHARGPVGVKELTTTKYIIYGNGQIRE